MRWLCRDSPWARAGRILIATARTPLTTWATIRRENTMSFFAKTSAIGLSAGTILLLSTCAPGPTIVRTAAVACDALASARWSGFTIDEAVERVAAENAPAHCVVRGTIDSEIHFELLLPLPDAWNGRFVMGGGGGFVGSVQNQALQFAPSLLADGFATVGTDTGHQGSYIDASWALARVDREINFGHRAVHLTAETAKTIIRLHFGTDIDYSYFIGCSRGGGQAMMESQRYPDDFDGIVAGAPAYDWPGFGAHAIQTQQALYPDPGDLSTPVVTPRVRKLLAATILAACDDLDGVTDGILGDPRDCDFQPEDLPACGPGAGNDACVTPAQLEAIQTIYRGAMVDGELVYPGFPFGGESDAGGWGNWITGRANAFGPGTPSLHFAFGTQIYKYLVFDDPEWDFASYDFSNWEREKSAAASILNATDPDLTPFKVAGGKLIFFNGWSDAALTAFGAIQYYEAMAQEDPHAASYARLFLMPGVLHCGRGPGPDQVDWLAAIQRWVERGEAPDRLLATKRGASGEIEMQRPLCAYPAVATYDGSGDPKREESFECVVPTGTVRLRR